MLLLEVTVKGCHCKDDMLGTFMNTILGDVNVRPAGNQNKK